MPVQPVRYVLTNCVPMFEILQPGLLSTLQDKGRTGMRHLGIPWSGVMVPPWQMLANALVGNETNNTVVECFEGGFKGVFQQTTRIAVAADDSATLSLVSNDTVTPCLPFQSYDVSVGTTLIIKSTGDLRLAILAMNGLDATKQLGSSATYIKAGLGGIKGRALKPGDKLAVSDTTGPLLVADKLSIPGLASGELHAVAGPQDHHFSKQGLQVFFSAEYALTTDADRMGSRLQGPIIEHLNTAARDIVSDAILPGSVQVPGNGQPIVLLADAHTAGGYPKIATVASLDLSVLALARPGTLFRFKQVSASEAVQLTRNYRAEVQKALSSLKIIRHPIDTMSLLSHNLIDGVTDGSG